MPFRELTLQRRYTGQAGQLVNSFYVPVLGQATRYDRQSAYFDSASLVQVAAGLAAFLERVRGDPPPDGRAPMRLITGAEWHQEDMEAYRRGIDALGHSLGDSLAHAFDPEPEECRRLGLPENWRPEADQIAQHRFGALAWMIAHQLLEIRVALPLDADGRPYHPGRGGALFHPKAGLLYNSNEDVVFFQGSVNETGAAWNRNREKFEVKRTWYSDQDREDIRAEQEEFEKLWNGCDPGVLIVPLPQAIAQRLITLAPAEPPAHDIMEEGQLFGAALPADREMAQFLLRAPRSEGGAALVLEPLTLVPYPHQARVTARAAGEFPRRFLFCDEVGLGKTIEAGLALRTLLLRGQADRILILAPRGLVRQWQEELREKFALTAWHYDGRHTLIDVGGRGRFTDRPWDEDGILIASRQFAARRAHVPELLDARRPWDLVIVDEAHAARRQQFDETAPNLLLELLQGLKTRNLMRGLWLLTATPMQLAPQEVHDLLELCGVDEPAWDGWRNSFEFERYFDDLRDFPTDPAVRERALKMAAVAVGHGAPALDAGTPPAPWEAFSWRNLVDQINHYRPGLGLALRRLTQAQAEGLTAHLARQTPLGVHMFRYTRTTLRAYQQQGRFSGSVPEREPVDVPLQLVTEQERELYVRIDELCSRFYRLAELPPGERQGVGFLRAVFRKRLASSFAAFRKSLERRRDLIRQSQEGELEEPLREALEAEAAEEERAEDSGAPENWIEQERQRVSAASRDRREQERLYLQRYLNDLAALNTDSKFGTFQQQLDRLLAAGHRVIVFTQYLDTLDFIRDHLVLWFGDRLVCYSGRGGEIWDAGANSWRTVEKAVVKVHMAEDHPRPAQILLATDAAAEGLNLQQFSAVVNYDLPWNPMRVEQRIGRIDRIGQPRPVVAIANLYTEGTIEQDAYAILQERIGFFEEVVGPLQPILAEMPRLLRRVALGEMERADALREMERIAQAPSRGSLQHLEEFTNVFPEQPAPTPALVTQRELATWCLEHPAMGMTLTRCPEPGVDRPDPDPLKACYQLTWAYAPEHLALDPEDEVLVTFHAALADRHPPTAPGEDEEGSERPGFEGVRLLTWGEPLLTAWLEWVARTEPLAPFASAHP